MGLLTFVLWPGMGGPVAPGQHLRCRHFDRAQLDFPWLLGAAQMGLVIGLMVGVQVMMEVPLAG